MELKDFIKNTISSISEAILESQSELSDKGVLINPDKYYTSDTGDKMFSVHKHLNSRHIQTLSFDVLVGVESEKDSKKGGVLKVAELLSIGTDKSNTLANTNQNRIQFEIPIAFSTVEVPAKLIGEEFAIK